MCKQLHLFSFITLKTRGLIVLGSILGYLIVSFIFYPTHGLSAGSLVIVPILICSWCFGLRVGLLAALFFSSVNIFMVSAITHRRAEEALYTSAPNYVVIILVTLVAGHTYYIEEQLKQEAARRSEAETALNKSETRFQTFVEQSPFSTQIFRPDGSVLTVNQAFSRLWRADPVETQYIVDRYNILKDEQLESGGLMPFIKKGFTEGFAEIPEIKYDPQKTDMVKETGLTTKWVIGYIWPVKDERGEVQQVVLVHQDITERKQVEAQQLEMAIIAERAELLKDLLNTLSHDLKTPLSIMNTSLYLIEKVPDALYQQNKLDNIKEQSKRLNTILQNILTVSYLDTAAEAIVKPVDLNSIVSQVQQEFSQSALDRSIELKFEPEDDLPLVRANEVEFHRVFINLVENALNYTPSGGRITLRTFQEDNKVAVEVSDTGIGIEQEDLARIFEHFYRADKARSNHYGGTGLGLAIVKKIVERHGGTIEVHSTPGQGSTFRIWLPLL